MRHARTFGVGLLFMGMLLLLAVCGPPAAASGGQRAEASHEHAAQAAPDVAATSEFSVYDITASWLDQDGVQRELSSLTGRPQVIAMLYTHCGVTCPRILADMKRIEAALGDDAARVGFTLVSIDPTRDTPARLTEFATSTRLDLARWTMLTAADDDAVLELATLLGVRYRRVGDTEYEHSNVITVLDAHGAIAHRQVGVPSDPAESVLVLRSLLGN